jgi:DNA polymerase-3 subunit delta
MLHLLHGSDEYSLGQAARTLARDAAGGDETFIVRYDGASATWPALQEACCTVSMFAPAQVVLVQGLLSAWGGRSEGSAKSQQRPSPEDFAAFVAVLPASTHLFLVESALSEANRYARALSKLGAEQVQIQSFLALEGPALERWVAAAARERGGSIDPPAAQELVLRGGQDLRRLSQELDKLFTYTAPGRHIGLDAVDALVIPGEDVSAFGLVDAVAARQAPRAVQLVEQLLNAGEVPESLLALLGVRIRDLLLLASAEEEGISDQAAASQLGWKPGRLGHLQKVRRQFTLADLRAAQAVLVAVDAALKSRASHERPILLLEAVLTIAQRKGLAELESVLAN